MGKSKYYVVWKGHQPGVYSDWASCKAQVDGVEGARYKSYEDKQSADRAYADGPPTTSNYTKPAASATKGKVVQRSMLAIEANSISVDAACSGNPGDMEYRCVKTMSKEEIFKKGPFKEGTNNIGEFLALVHALALLDNHKRYDVTIYTDSKTAMAWVRNKKAKSTLKLTKHNAVIFDMVEKAEKWLMDNTVKNPIVKWETEVWGGIPADFGRK